MEEVSDMLGKTQIEKIAKTRKDLIMALVEDNILRENEAESEIDALLDTYLSLEEQDAVKSIE